jgi:hypothetical protein
LSSQEQELRRLRNLDPYPSSDNIQMVRRFREEVQKLYRFLQEAVMQDQLKVPDVRSDVDEFVRRLLRTQRKLRDLAQSRKVAIADKFAFGFSRYDNTFPCRSPVATGDDCTRVLALLAKQLVVVEELTTLAVSNGVDCITLIRRIEVEPSPAGGSSPAGDVLSGTIDNDPQARYHTLPFDLQFVCNETTLRSFLNSLSRSGRFFNVKTVAIDRKVPDNLMRAIEMARNPTPGTLLSQATASPQRKLLMVTMRIDLVEFPNPKSKTGEMTAQPR